MELILDLLRRLPDYPRLRAALEGAQAVGVSGAAQINRSHLIAALCRDTARPAVVVCQDEMAARRTQSELAAFLGAEAPILPTRDLMFYDASAISRGWEQQRLRCLYDLARGKTPLLLTTLEAFSLRTMPKAQLFSAAMRLLPGAQLELEELISRLLHAGYSRCSLVEGAGQFSVRGGIVDIFSPAEERPVRLEFFGDEIDTMGYFDPVTQRRVENADELVILPVAETLPALHPGGIEGLARELDGLLARQRRRKTPNEALMRTLQADADALRGGLAFSAADRYQALIYPEFACAADYLPAEALVFFCDHAARAGGAGHDARQPAAVWPAVRRAVRFFRRLGAAVRPRGRARRGVLRLVPRRELPAEPAAVTARECHGQAAAVLRRQSGCGGLGPRVLSEK